VSTIAVESAVAERERVLTHFLDTESERLARACHAMARHFSRGGTLVAFGTGAAATDAAHAAVEFMHPVIVGKRALPALAPSNDPTGRSVPALMLGPDDIALAISHGGDDAAVGEFVDVASRRGALTIALSGRDAAAGADFAFSVASDDPHIVQEVHETAYHVLWELVHVFFEHPGLLEERCITCGDVAVPATVVEVHGATAVVERGGAREEVAAELVAGVTTGDVLLCHAGIALERLDRSPDDPSGFLYPFLNAEEQDLDTVLADVRGSTVQKGRDVIALRAAIDSTAVERCAGALRERLTRGGRILTFGNGGSSTDAQDLAADALGRGIPAIALDNDVATITAVANDVGFENVFARQVIPLARADDVAVAISTSGASPSVLAGLAEANRRGMLTVAVTGYDGGRLADADWLDHLLIVRADYVPRIQEAQATIYHLLLAQLP